MLLNTTEAKEMLVKILEKSNKGKSIIAQKDLLKGELVISSGVDYYEPRRNNHSVQVEVGKHILMSGEATFLNHSCEPNLGVKNNKKGAYDFFALRNISEGEEVCFDYETTEFISIAVKECLCQSHSCRKWIKGFSDHPQFILDRYSPYVANYLQNLAKIFF